VFVRILFEAIGQRFSRLSNDDDGGEFSSPERGTTSIASAEDESSRTFAIAFCLTLYINLNVLSEREHNRGTKTCTPVSKLDLRTRLWLGVIKSCHTTIRDMRKQYLSYIHQKYINLFSRSRRHSVIASPCPFRQSRVSSFGGLLTR